MVTSTRSSISCITCILSVIWCDASALNSLQHWQSWVRTATEITRAMRNIHSKKVPRGNKAHNDTKENSPGIYSLCPLRGWRGGLLPPVKMVSNVKMFIWWSTNYPVIFGFEGNAEWTKLNMNFKVSPFSCVNVCVMHKAITECVWLGQCHLRPDCERASLATFSHRLQSRSHLTLLLVLPAPAFLSATLTLSELFA